MNKWKSLKELNLLDKFLFDEAMDDPENVKTMLDIILSKKTNLKHSPQTEKEQRTSTDNRQIRLDVYAMDEDDVIYEVEAQKENTHNLPKRSRLYQGIIDSKLLPPVGIPRTDRTFEIYGTQYRWSVRTVQKWTDSKDA